jgi:hypothetical protein
MMMMMMPGMMTTGAGGTGGTPGAGAPETVTAKLPDGTVLKIEIQGAKQKRRRGY